MRTVPGSRNAFVVLAHPDPRSLCGSIASACRLELERLGYTVEYHDLYAEKFPAVLPNAELERTAKVPAVVRRHGESLGRADALVVVHPNWWGQPPGVMKGWIDRVFRPGVAYRFREGDGGEGIPEGLLKARFAFVVNTSNTERGRETEKFGDPLGTIWKNCILGLCGVDRVVRKTFGVVVTSTNAERKKWIADAVRTLRRCAGEAR